MADKIFEFSPIAVNVNEPSQNEPMNKIRPESSAAGDTVESRDISNGCNMLQQVEIKADPDTLPEAAQETLLPAATEMPTFLKADSDTLQEAAPERFMQPDPDAPTKPDSSIEKKGWQQTELIVSLEKKGCQQAELILSLQEEVFTLRGKIREISEQRLRLFNIVQQLDRELTKRVSKERPKCWSNLN